MKVYSFVSLNQSYATCILNGPIGRDHIGTVELDIDMAYNTLPYPYLILYTFFTIKESLVGFPQVLFKV